jgi:hypothetical protein
MELKDIIAPNYRKTGLSCHNCTHLVREYDLDAHRLGVWICDKHPACSTSVTFPFAHQMPCFELCFWFSIFAGDFGESTSAYEDAVSRFSESIAGLKTPALPPETLLPQNPGPAMHLG